MARTRKRPSSPGRASRLKRRLVVLVVVALGLWVALFDSQSLYRRWQVHREADRLTRENEELRTEIERLEAELQRGLSDEEIERIAREQYGMRREGETVYPLKQ